MASVFKRTTKRGTTKWYARYKGADGRWRKKSCGSDKTAAQQIAGKLDTDARLRLDGIIDAAMDRFAAAERKPLAEHLAEFQADVESRKGNAAYAAQTYQRCRRVLDAVEVKRISELKPAAVNAGIATLKESLSKASIQHHIRAVKMFSRWLMRNGRCRDDALAGLPVGGLIPKAERVHQRRPLSADELRELLAYARTAPARWNMPGADRAMLYATAAGTGFRSNELRSLTPISFKMDEPAIFLSGSDAKNHKDILQPINAELAAELRPWLKARKAGVPVFTMPSKANVVRMFREDMAHARIAFLKRRKPGGERRKLRQGDFLRSVDGEGRYADFHALRATFITMLARANVPLKVLQTLARHSTPVLTMNAYATMGISDMDAAVATLPSFNPRTANEPERRVLRATGTTDTAPVYSPPVCPRGTRVGQTTAENGRELAESGIRGSGENQGARGQENPINMRFSEHSGELGRAGIEPATQGFSVLCSTN